MQTDRIYEKIAVINFTVLLNLNRILPYFVRIIQGGPLKSSPENLNRCQLGALSASSITSQMHKFQLGSTSRIFCNTTDYLNNATVNLNYKRMFLFSTTFSRLLLSGPPCNNIVLDSISITIMESL